MAYNRAETEPENAVGQFSEKHRGEQANKSVDPCGRFRFGLVDPDPSVSAVVPAKKETLIKQKKKTILVIPN